MPVDSSLHTITPYLDLTRQTPASSGKKQSGEQSRILGPIPEYDKDHEIAKSLSITTLPLQQ